LTCSSIFKRSALASSAPSRNLCFNNSLALDLYFGSFYKHFSRKSLISSDHVKFGFSYNLGASLREIRYIALKASSRKYGGSP